MTGEPEHVLPYWTVAGGALLYQFWPGRRLVSQGSAILGVNVAGSARSAAALLSRSLSAPRMDIVLLHV